MSLESDVDRVDDGFDEGTTMVCSSALEGSGVSFVVGVVASSIAAGTGTEGISGGNVFEGVGVGLGRSAEGLTATNFLETHASRGVFCAPSVNLILIQSPVLPIIMMSLFLGSDMSMGERGVAVS